ncbi:MAG: hypothetical protein KGJ65_03665 [Betaproteobacteria bacterium]|nr:hypothetical protein [Betaproteobacteria bacterium]MDE2122760.1 hypothetical protein [Betaproteobacteria bacterium]MDE2185701.1 hypothetical protein [Betaproteobacteria bacterium]
MSHHVAASESGAATAGSVLSGPVASSLLWTTQPLAIGLAAASVPPLLQASVATTSALFLVWLWTRWRNVPVFAQDNTLAPGAVLGLLFSARLGLMYLALARLPAPQAVALVFAALVAAQACLSLWGVLRRGHGLRARSAQSGMRPLAGLVLAAAGLLLAAHAAAAASLAVALLAGGVWAIEARIARGPRLMHCGGEKILFYQLIGAAVVLPVASVAAGENWLTHPSSVGWAALGAQVLLGGLALPLLWFAPGVAQRPRPLATLMRLAPLATVLMAWCFNAWIARGLMAQPDATVLAGCLLLTAAAWFTTRRE